MENDKGYHGVKPEDLVVVTPPNAHMWYVCLMDKEKARKGCPRLKAPDMTTNIGRALFEEVCKQCPCLKVQITPGW